MKEPGISGHRVEDPTPVHRLDTWEKPAPGLDPRAGCYPDGRKVPGSNVGLERSLWLGVKMDPYTMVVSAMLCSRGAPLDRGNVCGRETRQGISGERGFPCFCSF